MNRSVLVLLCIVFALPTASNAFGPLANPTDKLLPMMAPASFVPDLRGGFVETIKSTFGADAQVRLVPGAR